MGWTDERVEMLKKLWLDGQSASQIAKQLGGVTRNAVIGKVHRLGLSGRAAPSQPAGTVFKAPRPARPATGAVPVSRKASAAAAPAEKPTAPVAEPVVAEVTPVSPPVELVAAPAPVAATAAPIQAVVRIEERGGATVLTLGARMCKWPIGDPSSDEFTFCGRRSSEEGPYCVEHARVAYQPQQTKKKAPGADLARSLRRYV